MSNLFLLVICFLLMLVPVILFIRLKQQVVSYRTELALLQAHLESAQQLNSQLQSDLEELRAGVIGVGQRVLLLQEQQQQLVEQQTDIQEQQQAIALSDPESKIYSRAVKMVELGADLEEIMRECELPRAEAELLFNLHRQQRSD